MAATTTQMGEVGAAPGGFRRDVGLIGLLFTSLGSVIGSGWLLGALHGAQAAGPASLISWVIAGFVSIVLALMYAELGAAYPVAGGGVTFPVYAFGGMAGMVSGWMAWLGTVALAPIEVEAALTYLTNLSHLHWLTHTPHGSTSAVLTFPAGFLVALAPVLLFACINVLGVRWLARTNNAAVWWKVTIPVVTLVAIMATSFRSGNFAAGVWLAKPADQRPALDVRHNWWVLPWLGGLTLISAFGQYSTSTKEIPFWWDMAVVAAFSLAIYALALTVHLPARRAAAYVEESTGEMEAVAG